MSENVESTTWNQPTLLSEDSLASLIVWPGGEEARRMTVTSGLNFYALLKDSDPRGFLRRMFQASYHCISTRYYLTWRVKTTLAGRLIFQLALSEPHIDGIVSSSWPTPTSRDWRSGKASEATYRRNSRPLSERVVRTEMWPTPRANSAMAATITEEADPDHYPNLETVVKKRNPSAVGGQLNPQWVEWLMGFPIGWTDLGHLETP